MSIRKLLSELDFSIHKEEEKRLSEETKDLVSNLSKKVSADVFVGGSFAKGSLIKKKKYDIDIFVRFDWKKEDISGKLEKALKDLKKKQKFKLTKIHGSRDYFRIEKEGIIFEIVPVTKIKNPREARNVTDLSYFHVKYVKRNINKKNLKKEVAFAKKFFEAQKVYGAESYVKGFSGYGLECLIIYYGSFEKMLRALIKVKERIVLDPEKKYKKKSDIFFDVNDSKLHSPVILIDPTWKERNVLAALNNESFAKLQKAAKAFLRKPSKKFFDLEEVNIESLKKEAKKKKAEFIEIELETKRQRGDIAGSKLKKFSEFMTRELSKSFEILKKEFEYDDGQIGRLYLVVKPKKEIVRIGPPIKMKKHASAFKKRNKKTYVKHGILHSITKVNYKAKDFLKKFVKVNKERMNDMGVSSLNIN